MKTPRISKQKKWKRNLGMTYVELIVVLSIFSLMSGIIMFNYKQFQARVDIRTLANDIALKFSQAQKEAVYGRTNTSFVGDTKPSYGIYIPATTGVFVPGVGSVPADTGCAPVTGGFSDASRRCYFVYFADYDNNKQLNNVPANPNDCMGECLEIIRIGRGSDIRTPQCYGADDGPLSIQSPMGAYTLIFTRPSSEAYIHGCKGAANSVSFTVRHGTQDAGATIYIYKNGRIRVN